MLLEHDRQRLWQVHLAMAEPKALAVVLAWTLHTSGESNEHCRGSLLPSQGIIRRWQKQGCWWIACGEASGWVVILVGESDLAYATVALYFGAHVWPKGVDILEWSRHLVGLGRAWPSFARVIVCKESCLNWPIGRPCAHFRTEPDPEQIPSQIFPRQSPLNKALDPWHLSPGCS